jgi:sensor histidine kinase YesM
VAYTIISELSRLRQENHQVPRQRELKGEFKAIQAYITRHFLKNVIYN